MNTPIHVTIWSEFRHEKQNEKVAALYPRGIHEALAEPFRQDAGFVVRTATLDEPEHGLAADVLETTDVLLWWGHKAHDEVADEIERLMPVLGRRLVLPARQVLRVLAAGYMADLDAADLSGDPEPAARAREQAATWLPTVADRLTVPL